MKRTTMYTIKSVSNEGIWYLVNHWNEHRTYWNQKDNITPYNTFASPRTAKANLTKLLKVMEDYRTDDFTLVKFKWNEAHNCYDEIELGAIKYPMSFWKKYHKVIVE